MKKEKRILSIGAHPDDADTYCGGLLSKLRDKGWQVRLLSVTDGSAGTYHAEVTREELKLQRRLAHIIPLYHYLVNILGIRAASGYP